MKLHAASRLFDNSNFVNLANINSVNYEPKITINDIAGQAAQAVGVSAPNYGER
jgi:hypothetical protein